MPDSSSYSFPKTNGLGFIDFLLKNLKEKLNSDNRFLSFAKHVIIKIEQELIYLRPSLDEICKVQTEQKELHETWMQLINLAYLTEHLVNSCYVVLYPFWYTMLSLCDILDEIKVIKVKLDNVKLTSFESATFENPTQASHSSTNEVLVGCDEEVDLIVDQLTRGPKSLEIVSVVGMGGSGKTTLARKVYDTHQVRRRFHIFAFCIVSQVYSTRKLLLEILKDINLVYVDDNSKTDDDLAHLLKKQLSGRRYLVVVDDIWTIDAWEKLKSSFPDENIGSRVIFTTRECEVAVKAKSKFRPHSKHLLSDKESWELLQKRAFLEAACPSNLSKVGQVIARNCGGLPLAVEVIGRLLARKERSMRVWNEIAEKTSSFASEEGCMKVLELSYNHLPEHLKSCFLYLGVFAREDGLIPAKRLMLLWIAEGFVQKPQMESIEFAAKEYLTELVDRSLVQAAKRSSDNGIKACQLHDVIRHFCLSKAQEENFSVAGFNSSHSNQYRLCIHMDRWMVLYGKISGPVIKSLLFSGRWMFSYECDSRKFNFLKFQLVQILDLEEVWLTGRNSEADKIIESISSLVHLRYLAVSIRKTNIRLPAWITNLKNLETLILRRTLSISSFWWSENIWHMERLRYVDVGRCYLIPCPPKFEDYPPLYNLECFSTLVFRPGTASKLLQRLPNLRKLSCVFSASKNGEILALDVLSKLESLKLRAYGENVILPATLKKLYLHGGSLSSQLGRLPHLEVLKIECNSEQRWNNEDGDFPELKFLKLENCGLKAWNASDGSFPRVEQLVLVACALHKIPASFGESATLKRIEVPIWSRRLRSSACQIRDEQKELGNDIELIFSYRKN